MLMISGSKRAIKRILLKRVLRRSLPMSLVSPGYEPPVQIKPLEGLSAGNGKIPCNLNFDDLCPKYMDEYGVDFGGRADKGLSIEFKRFLDDYPHAGVTVFVIPLCMIRRRSLRFSRQPRDRYSIAAAEHAEWLDFYKKLAAKFNIEYALHGCHHRQFENLLFSRRTEFAFKNEKESAEAIALALTTFKLAGLEPCGFRQPGWDINSDLSLVRVLKKNGFDVVSAKDGIECVRHAKRESFQAIIMDVRMPNLDGIGALRNLRKAHVETPVVLMSGFCELSSIGEVKEEGAQAFFPKPFSPKKVVEYLKQNSWAGSKTS